MGVFGTYYLFEISKVHPTKFLKNSPRRLVSHHNIERSFEQQVIMPSIKILVGDEVNEEMQEVDTHYSFTYFNNLFTVDIMFGNLLHENLIRHFVMMRVSI